MATLNKIYTFNSSDEGFTLVNTPWDSVNGWLQNATEGRNTKLDGLATISGITYASLGVPANSTVDSVELKLDARLETWNVTSYAYFIGLFNGATVIPQYNWTGVTAWTPISSGTIPLTGATELSTFSLSIDSYQQNGNNASASTHQQFDNIEVVVNYTPPSPIQYGITNLTGAGSIQVEASEVIHFEYGITNLTGEGTLAADGQVIFAGLGTIEGSGVILGDAYVERYLQGQLEGTSDLLALGFKEIAGAAEVSGQSDILGQGVVERIGAAALEGSGQIQGDGELIVVGVANITGAGDVSARARGYLVLMRISRSTIEL